VTPPTLDCTKSGKSKCACWSDFLKPLYQSGKAPLVVAVTINQATELRQQIKSSANLEAFIKTTPQAYRRMSGTSMAT